MPEAIFAAFRAGCAEDARATLRRFAVLCSQGGEQPRALCRQLQEHLADSPADALLAGLDVLAGLDTEIASGRFGGPRLQLFADGDALVPAEAAVALAAVDPVSHVRVVESASHGFVLEQAALLAGEIAAFMDRCDG
jgi:pimeloyl-[acyl-carrier protein] methyl ester esterase